MVHHPPTQVDLNRRTSTHVGGPTSGLFLTGKKHEMWTGTPVYLSSRTRGGCPLHTSTSSPPFSKLKKKRVISRKLNSENQSGTKFCVWVYVYVSLRDRLYIETSQECKTYYLIKGINILPLWLYPFCRTYGIGCSGGSGRVSPIAHV